MSLALVLVAIACLVAAAVLWQRNKKAGVDGVGRGGTRIAIIVLVLGGVLIALASQLSIFR
ncbi:hypothetical protein [Microbacterium ulmi]|uniref:Uncharacterized protein n=1 Tax=Microbacterium ulmi TaxID=179095 RepID=A0A7Y2LZM4_9MICO|nr:hypothetical protein [Microbacterium ulmi]NII69211.1 uncharacterized membrane protein YidH (DUF202 family) [Microbacterium ulmi]NNH03749.1 hypothetical protein [Microbacterium ulmi]